MARSSTRQALKKGGNFMGMMNVLMQLRKVCNHPDLFEPRSVITPFALDPVVLPMPSCVLGVCSSLPVLETVSSYMLNPLWCGSQGQPSLSAALKHDQIESDQLLLLGRSLDMNEQVREKSTGQEDIPPPLRKLLGELREKERADKIGNMHFLNTLTSSRCKAQPFAFPERTINAVSVEGTPLKVWQLNALSTPSHLLAMRRNQQERADDVDGLVKKFVFCVPKAGGRRPSLAVNSDTDHVVDKTLNKMLLEPLEEYFRPYQRAHARLTSFFPDKKLIQFDAGKLQTLAELLRELKRGGHRVLIFTQMSKMLDILEAFLNLNGHTYLRLDGSTGVDRRQRLMDRFNNDIKIFCFILSTRSGGMGVNLTGADTVVFFDNDW
jgi:SNF2 family DNA or RNA helicase